MPARQKQLLLNALLLATCLLSLLAANVPEVRAVDPLQPWTGDFGGMEARRVIRALVPYNRTHFFMDKADMRGAAYEALTALEQQINKRSAQGHLTVDVLFVPVFRGDMLSSLVDGLGDIAIGGLTITPERLKAADFSDSVLDGIDEIVVAAPSAPAIDRIEDLAGKEVYVRKSSSYFESLQRLNTSLNKTGTSVINIKELPEYLEDEDILEMVNAGVIPLTIVDNYLAALWAQVLDKLVPYPDIAVNKGGSIAWMIRQDSPKLKTVLNEFIRGHRQKTLFGNIVIKRYYQNAKWIRNPLEDEELKRFKASIALFRKYGELYGIDWLLVAACAYQESRIDQRKRSPAGAVGIMQVLPSTAAAHPINIADIENTESNIHAGVKYLHWIYNRYFKDEGIDLPNQIRFTFAAYNAGPRRIRELRKDAEKMGLDPNLWFHNVEIAAAKRIGRETVQYVKNIHKYYTAYRIMADKGAIKSDALGKK